MLVRVLVVVAGGILNYAFPVEEGRQWQWCTQIRFGVGSHVQVSHREKCGNFESNLHDVFYLYGISGFERDLKISDALVRNAQTGLQVPNFFEKLF